MRRRSLGTALGLVFALGTVAACGDQGGAPEPPAATEPGPTAEAPAPAEPAAPAAGTDMAASDAALIDQGRQIFSGAGICFTCHGPEAQGTPLAPNLTDGEWLWIENPEENLHGKLVDLIRAGVPQPREAPAPMPPMGGASLNDEQLNAVAAYVASLSQ